MTRNRARGRAGLKFTAQRREFMVDLQATTTTSAYSALHEATIAEFKASLGGDLLTLEDRTKHPAVGLAYWNV
jgi:hypothetical protein